MNSRSGGGAEQPRRYKDNDEGEFLCGKWGWITAALLITAILTLSLLFGLGIFGGSNKKILATNENNRNSLVNQGKNIE